MDWEHLEVVLLSSTPSKIPPSSGLDSTSTRFHQSDAYSSHGSALLMRMGLVAERLVKDKQLLHVPSDSAESEPGTDAVELDGGGPLAALAPFAARIVLAAKLGRHVDLLLARPRIPREVDCAERRCLFGCEASAHHDEQRGGTEQNKLTLDLDLGAVFEADFVGGADEDDDLVLLLAALAGRRRAAVPSERMAPTRRLRGRLLDHPVRIRALGVLFGRMCPHKSVFHSCHR
ncbi:hypothetical protein HDK77DRAFT_201348 [Phyllosticta capitalensis]|uniref:Uncharacterized protein n=1 Tax=Phyllosticta capitalensis TaxID=121624 RepID=A0ABR1YX02_9PEZI